MVCAWIRRLVSVCEFTACLIWLMTGWRLFRRNGWPPNQVCSAGQFASGPARIGSHTWANGYNLKHNRARKTLCNNPTTYGRFPEFFDRKFSLSGQTPICSHARLLDAVRISKKKRKQGVGPAKILLCDFSHFRNRLGHVIAEKQHVEKEQWRGGSQLHCRSSSII
jgi:hypothetical protein